MREGRHAQVRGELGGVQRPGQPARPARIDLPDVHSPASQQPDLLGLVDGVLARRQRNPRPGGPQTMPAPGAGRQQFLGEGDLKIRENGQQPHRLVQAAAAQAVHHEPALARGLPYRGQGLCDRPWPGVNQLFRQRPLLPPEPRLCDPGRGFRGRRMGWVEPEGGGVGGNGVSDRAAQQSGHAHPGGTGGQVPAGQFDRGSGLPGMCAAAVPAGLLAIGEAARCCGIVPDQPGGQVIDDDLRDRFADRSLPAGDAVADQLDGEPGAVLGPYKAGRTGARRAAETVARRGPRGSR